MNFTPETFKIISRWVILTVAACILIFLGVQNIDMVAKAVAWVWGLLMPLTLGFIIALVLNVPMRAIEAHLWVDTENKVQQKLRRPIAVIVSAVFIIGVITGLIWLVVPELVAAVGLIAEGIMSVTSYLGDLTASDLANLPGGHLLLAIDWNTMLQNFEAWVREMSGKLVDGAISTVTGLFTSLFNIFVAVVFSVYVLFNKEDMKVQSSRLVRAWFPKEVAEWTIHICDVLNVNTRNFIAGQSIEAVILGTLCMVGMLILQIPYAPMIGALVGATALIPVIGAFLGGGIGAFVILTVDPVKALIFVVFILVLQQIEGNLIYPRVMGSQVNLPAMWVLASVAIGGGIAGAVGMLIAVPIGSSIYLLIYEATDLREEIKDRKIAEVHTSDEPPSEEKPDLGVAEGEEVAVELDAIEPEEQIEANA